MRRIVWNPERPRPPAGLAIALDEAFLLAAESGGIGSAFRISEFAEPTVVLGRSSKVDRETDRAFCDQSAIPIFRRCSGGASIVGGRGCLMYSLVLPIAEFPEIGKIDGAHRFVMGHLASAIRLQIPEVELQGICDLTWQNRKFSGNALRVTRNHVLYHGTILYDADLQLIGKCLDFAPRQPDYRGGRDHQSFITNVPLDVVALADVIATRFAAEPGSVPDSVISRAEQLASNRYNCDDWRYRH